MFGGSLHRGPEDDTTRKLKCGCSVSWMSGSASVLSSSVLKCTVQATVGVSACCCTTMSAWHIRYTSAVFVVQRCFATVLSS